MWRKIIALYLFALLGITSDVTAQNTSLKWNSLYWAMGAPNMSVETRLNHKFTFNGDVVVSPWLSINGRPYKGLQLISEARFYPKQAFKGFYVGAYLGYDSYELSKWGHPKTEIQHGIGLGVGATVGWQIDIARRWGMDFYVGYGWHHGWYYGVDETTGNLYVDWNKSAEWIPYKAGVTFAYRLGLGKPACSR